MHAPTANLTDVPLLEVRMPRSRPLSVFSMSLVALLGVVVGVSQSALAQPRGFGVGEDQPKEVEIFAFVGPDAQTVTVEPGGTAVVAVVLDHAEGWHSNLNKPVVPEEMEGFVPIPTTIETDGVDGITAGPVQWPEPKAVPVDFFFTGEPIDYLTYAGRAVAFVPVRIAEDAEVGSTLGLALEITYQACDDMTCLAPETVTRRVSFEVVEDATGLPSEGDFAGFDAGVFEEWGGGEVAGAEEPKAPAEAGAAAGEIGASGGDGGSFLGILALPTGGGVWGFVGLALISALGGAILNLTPCVLPVIPIKILTLSQHAGEHRGRTLALGAAMAFGVVAFWAALGVPAALFTSFADPSRVFGYWYVTAPLGLLMVILALGLMGMFSLNLPKAAYMVNPKADSVPGSFAFGIMTGVLGLPCFGFVAGALIPAATTLGTAAVIVIFTAIGVGMALPYLVLSIFPKLVEKLPRTGPASELVKQVLGLLLIGFGLFFFGTGVRALVKTHPFTAEVLHIYALSLAVIAAGVWLLWKTIRITKKPLNVAVFGLVAVVIAYLGVYISLGKTLQEKQDYEIRQAALESAGPGNILAGVWNEYSPELLEKALDQGKTVFVDFTADWCINCKVFEAQVLDKEPVRSVLRDPGVAMIKVDLTGSNRAGEQFLSDLGRVGIPTWAVLGPGLDGPRVISSFTPSAVLGALEAAAGTEQAASGGP